MKLGVPRAPAIVLNSCVTRFDVGAVVVLVDVGGNVLSRAGIEVQTRVSRFEVGAVVVLVDVGGNELSRDGIAL
jgi:hypothetical protein